jgi:hypothetical protein
MGLLAANPLSDHGKIYHNNFLQKLMAVSSGVRFLNKVKLHTPKCASQLSVKLGTSNDKDWVQDMSLEDSLTVNFI